MKTKERRLWIDLLKGIMIYLVVFGHLFPNLLIEKHIYSFHMCIFFFISGYLYTGNQNKKEYIIKKIKNLLLPFLIWNTICSLGSLLVRHDISLFFHYLFVINGDICWNAPLWFLIVLFPTELIFFFIEDIQIFKNKYLYHLIISIISLILFILVGTHQMTLYINLIPLALLFYNLGYMYKLVDKFINKDNKLMLTILCIFLITINIYFSVVLNERIVYTGSYFDNMLYFAISSFTGVLGYFLLFEIFTSKLKTKNFLTKIGYSSMTIMIFQYFVFKFYNLISIKLFGLDIWHYRSTIKAFFLSILTIVIIYFFKSIIEKIFQNDKYKRILKYIGII